MKIHGYEHIHEERIVVGPDGKPVRNVYTLKRELNAEQAAELAEKHRALFAPMERMFDDMERMMNDMFGPMDGTPRRAFRRAGGR